MVFGGTRIEGARNVTSAQLKLGAQAVAKQIAGQVGAAEALSTLETAAGKLATKGKRLAIYDRTKVGVTPRFARQYMISAERAEHTVSVVKSLFNSATSAIQDRETREAILHDLGKYLSAKDTAIRGSQLQELVNRVKSAVASEVCSDAPEVQRQQVAQQLPASAAQTQILKPQGQSPKPARPPAPPKAHEAEGQPGNLAEPQGQAQPMQAPAMGPLAGQQEDPQEPVQAQPEMHPSVVAHEVIGEAAMAPLQEEHPKGQNLQAQEEPPVENEPPINQQEPVPVPAQASAQQSVEDDLAFHEQADLELPHYVESPSDRSQLYPSQGPEAGPPLGSLQDDWLDQNGQPLPDVDDAYAQAYLNHDEYFSEGWENPDQYDPSREIEGSSNGGYRNDEASLGRDLDSDDGGLEDEPYAFNALSQRMNPSHAGQPGAPNEPDPVVPTASIQTQNAQGSTTQAQNSQGESPEIIGTPQKIDVPEIFVDRVSQGDADEVLLRPFDSVSAQARQTQATEPAGLREAIENADIRYGDVARFYEWLGLGDEDQADKAVLDRKLSGSFYKNLPEYLRDRQDLIEQYTGTTQQRSKWKQLETGIAGVRDLFEGDLRTFKEIAASQAADNERMGVYMQENAPEEWGDWQRIVGWAENIASDLQELLDVSQQDLPDAEHIQALRQKELEEAMAPLASLATLATQIEDLSRASIEELAKAQKELIADFAQAETKVRRDAKQTQIEKVRQEAKVQQANIQGWAKQLGEPKALAQETLKDFEAIYGTDLGNLCDPLKAQIDRITGLQKDLADKAGDLQKLLATRIDEKDIRPIKIDPVQSALSAEVASALKMPVSSSQEPQAFQELSQYFQRLIFAAERAMGKYPNLSQALDNWSQFQKNQLIGQLSSRTLLNALSESGSASIALIEQWRDRRLAEVIRKFEQRNTELQKSFEKKQERLQALKTEVQRRTKRLAELPSIRQANREKASKLAPQFEKYKAFAGFEQLIEQLKSEPSDDLVEQVNMLRSRLEEAYSDLAPVLDYRVIQLMLEEAEGVDADSLRSEIEDLENEHQANKLLMSAMRNPRFFSEELPAIDAQLEVNIALDKENNALVDGDPNARPEPLGEEEQEIDPEQFVLSQSAKSYAALESDIDSLQQSLQQDQAELAQIRAELDGNRQQAVDDAQREIESITDTVQEMMSSAARTVEEIRRK